jgi:virginiamycin B lyase
MRRFKALIMAAAVLGSASIAAAARAQDAQVITVPGFADFLAVDGKTVWTTNRGRVEQWSLEKGKLAEVPLTHPCGAMAILGHDLWVANCADGSLNRIDMHSAKLVATVPTGLAHPPEGELMVAAGAGSVWVASDAKGVVSRVDPSTNKVIASIPVDPGTTYVTFGFGSLWAVDLAQQSIQKIDPATNSVVKRTHLGKAPGFLAAGEGAVWVQEQGDGTVARIDPESGEVTGRVKIGETLKWGDIDTGGGKVWLRTTDGQVFVVIDPKSLAILARVGKASGSGALRYTPSGVWTTAHDEHTLTWWPDPEKIGN